MPSRYRKGKKTYSSKKDMDLKLKGDKMKKVIIEYTYPDDLRNVAEMIKEGYVKGSNKLVKWEIIK